MSGYTVSPEANQDLFEIWRYPARHAGVEIANRVENKLYEAFEALSRTPGLGHRREDLTSHAVFFFTVYSYMVVYRLGTQPEIVRVLHGRRNVQRLLKQLSSEQ
jgi:toxin ParE1/3/4